jgi:hypothetical protein
MKCANCGNNNPDTLFDEGDTIYCSVCCHRTLKATGKDDLIKCPYCGRLRDRKAFSCMWCGNSLDSSNKPTRKERKELKKFLEDFDNSIDSSNVRYWYLRKKDGKK